MWEAFQSEWWMTSSVCNKRDRNIPSITPQRDNTHRLMTPKHLGTHTVTASQPGEGAGCFCTERHTYRQREYKYLHLYSEEGVGLMGCIVFLCVKYMWWTVRLQAHWRQITSNGRTWKKWRHYCTIYGWCTTAGSSFSAGDIIQRFICNFEDVFVAQNRTKCMLHEVLQGCYQDPNTEQGEEIHKYIKNVGSCGLPVATFLVFCRLSK